MLILEYPILPLSRCCPELQDTLYPTRNRAPPVKRYRDEREIGITRKEKSERERERELLN